MTVTAANPIAYLPLLSASGLGAAIVSSLVSPFSPVALSGNTLGNRFPDSGAEPMQPLPQVPDSPPSIHPPTAEGSSEPLEQPSLGGIAQLLPIDVEAIQSSVDAFFQQLGSLSEEWRDGRVLEKLAPWLLAASIAGYGWIQLRSQRRPATQALLADFHCLRSGLIDATSFPRGEKE